MQTRAARQALGALLRNQISVDLQAGDVVAVQGEDLIGVGAISKSHELNPALKENLFASQIALIVILCVSPGAMGELAFVSEQESLSRKTVVAIHRDHQAGFIATGVLKNAENFGARTVWFSDSDLVDGAIKQTLGVQIATCLEAELQRCLRAGIGAKAIKQD